MINKHLHRLRSFMKVRRKSHIKMVLTNSLTWTADFHEKVRRICHIKMMPKNITDIFCVLLTNFLPKTGILPKKCHKFHFPTARQA